jgi:eukaryotic-like serine/threonine-protein kinase
VECGLRMIWAVGTMVKKGQYKIEEVIRPGRLITTYLATSKKGHRVIIKSTNSDTLNSLDSSVFRQQFSEQAFRLERCKNRYIVEVEEPFEEGNSSCIPMKFISGTTLDKRDPLKMEVVDAVRYIRQIGEALTVLHENNFIHRDVRPENIMLRMKGDQNDVVLIDFELVKDFGISRTMTLSDQFITAFTSPELCASGESRGPYTDVYSLGAVMFSLVVGENPPSVLQRKAGDPLVFDLGTDPKIAAAIESAMALDRADRPGSVSEWLKMFAESPVTSESLSLSKSPSSIPPRHEPIRSTPRSVNWTTIVAAVAAIGGLMGGVAAIMTAMKPSEPTVKITPVQGKQKESPGISK